ncbi:hypothetical protein [Streptosporangium sp. NPDC006930]|uniref:hypothetical protein n=1 Tax=unclassified Streptosporangium TaxID=2632669 RepID=UPI00343B67DB
MIRAEQRAFTNAISEGDSGGPVEVVNPSDNTQVYAADVTSAYDNGTSVPVHRLCERRPYLRLAHVPLPVEQRDRGLP